MVFLTHSMRRVSAVVFGDVRTSHFASFSRAGLILKGERYVKVSRQSGRSFVGILPSLFVPADPLAATAQSAISGIVRDTTGAVLPGVTVEATSPVLIEKTRTAVTDAEGRYTIVDLRPGMYTVAFTLSGFNTLRREGLELPTNFTCTINADLRVGVARRIDHRHRRRAGRRRPEHAAHAGADPRPARLGADGAQLLGPCGADARRPDDEHRRRRQPADGADLHDRPRLAPDRHDRAGRRHAAEQPDERRPGAGLLQRRGERGDELPDERRRRRRLGRRRAHQHDPEGGREPLSGSAFVGGTNGSWQSDNVTADCAPRACRRRPVEHIKDYNFSFGGPIMRDKLWFFTTCRRISTNEIVANNFYPDGTPGIEDQWIQNQMLRLTWQVSPRNKLTAYHDRYPKFKGHEMGAFTDPETAAARRDSNHALYYTGQAKWTSTVTPRCCSKAATRPTSSTSTSAISPACRRSAARRSGTPDRHIEA